MKISRSKSSGFTLMEIMVVIALIGIAATVAPPMFTAYFHMIDLRNDTNALRQQLLMARLRAISNPDVHCGVYFDMASSPQKALIFYDINGDNRYIPADDELYMAPEIIEDRCLLYEDPDDPIIDKVVVFRGDGSAFQGGRVRIKSKNDVRKRAIDVLASTGRVKVIKL